MAKPILASALGTLLLAASTPAFAADPAPSAPAAPPADSAAASTVAPAAAPPPAAEPEKNPAQDPVVATRRGGFTVGLMGAFGLGNITGYPLDVAKRGKAEYLADTGVAFGPNGNFFVGAALSDWLVFGLGLGGTYSLGKDTVVSGYTFLLHTEVFPLFWLGGVFRDTGISLDTGAGQITGELANKPSGAAGKQIAPVIDSGAASRVAVSAFYDGLRLWKMSAGPYVAFDYTWSATLSQPLFQVGLRAALYVKAPTKK